MHSPPLHILALPPEIIDRIVSYFGNAFIQRGEIQWGMMHRAEIHWSQFDKHLYPSDLEAIDRERLQVICSLRLTCKTLNKAASARLQPIPLLRLSQESVEAFDYFCRNSDIAEGIHGLKIALDYRPDSLAASFDQFKRWQAESLFRVSTCCKHLLEKPSDAGEQTGQVALMAKMEQNHPLWDTFCHTDDFLSVCEGNGDLAPPKYEQLLRQAYDLYRARYEEQRRILGDGSFVETIARIVAKLPRAVEICFMNEQSGRSLQEFREANHSLSTDAKTVDYLSRTWAWEAIGLEKPLCGSATIEAVRILTELIASIGQRGCTILRLHLHCFPSFEDNDFDLLHLDGNSVTGAVMDDISRAMSKAESFSLGGTSMSTRPIRREHLAANKREYISNYINSCLTSSALRKLDLDLFAFGRGNRDGSISSGGGMPFGKMLQNVDGSKLVSLNISYASFSEKDLLSFIKTLGDRLELCLLRWSHMQSGTWAECIETLREKRTASLREGVWIFFDMLSGGGFGDFENELVPNRHDPRTWEPSNAERELYVLNKQASKYVNGMIDVHPLRK